MAAFFDSIAQEPYLEPNQKSMYGRVFCKNI